MALVRCPVCGKRFDSAELTNSVESTNMPFCSDRCRGIDLGRWLGESYSLPAERTDEDEADYDEEGN